MKVVLRKGERRSQFATMRGKDVAVAAIVRAFTMASDRRRRLARRGEITGSAIMLVGLPASGKSTLTDAFVAAGWVQLNKDAIRLELYGDASVLGDKDEVNRIFYERLEAACKANRNVVVDNININYFFRKGPIKAVREAGYSDVTNVVLDVPLEECLKRNAGRDRKVPEDQIRQLAATLHGGGMPTPREARLLVLSPGSARNRFVVNKSRAWVPSKRSIPKPARPPK